MKIYYNLSIEKMNDDLKYLLTFKNLNILKNKNNFIKYKKC